MIKKIKPKKDSFEEKILLFKETEELQRLVVLFGGNGVGKTTFLKGIKKGSLEMEKSKPIKVRMYTNSQNNVAKATPQISNLEILEQVMLGKEMSEGQSIIYSFLGFMESVKKDCTDNPAKTVVMIIDEIDSGLSVENINMVCHLLNEALEEYENLQIFLSSNNYHFVYVYKNVLNMYTGKWTEFNTYDTYYQTLSNEMIKLGKKRGFKFLNQCNYDVINHDPMEALAEVLWGRKDGDNE